MFAESIVAESEKLRDLAGGGSVLVFVEDCFRSLGASHFLATGLPLPGRPVEPLVLRMTWGDPSGERVPLDAGDPALRPVLCARRPFIWRMADRRQSPARESRLFSLAGPVNLIGVPIVAFAPYQACVLAAGAGLDADVKALRDFDYFCTEAFRRMIELGFVKRERPGELSAREREVIALTALGRTANEIAGELGISQRTVHAHLQNAGDKLRAGNKTQTVVEALRYGQIEI